jgi:predicted NBD/HSP70 family sugar kinase
VSQSSPARPTLLRHLNDAAVLSVLLDAGAATRAELAARTGLSKPTVGEAVARLLSSGRLREAGEEAGRRGPNGRLYDIDLSRTAGLAILVEPRGITAELVDARDTVLATLEDKEGGRRPDATRTVADLADRLTRAAGLTDAAVATVVISVPGSYDPVRDQVRYADRVPAWTGPGITARLAATIPAAVVIENDANLALVAESQSLADDTIRIRSLLWLADGVGLATQIDGTVFRGTSGGAGEIGYVPVPPPTSQAPAARPTHVTDFQDLVGARAVLALARRHGVTGRTAADTVAHAVALSGSGGCSAFLDELSGRIAVGLAIVAAVLDPGQVILGGPVGAAGGRQLAQRTQRALRSTSRLSCAVLPSAVAADAVLGGARIQAARQVRAQLLDTTSHEPE